MTLIYFFVESSVVKLTPEAFLNPTAYLDTSETKSTVKTITEFISGDISTNPGLKVIGFLCFFPLKVNLLMMLSSFVLEKHNNFYFLLNIIMSSSLIQCLFWFVCVLFFLHIFFVKNIHIRKHTTNLYNYITVKLFSIDHCFKFNPGDRKS